MKRLKIYCQSTHPGRGRSVRMGLDWAPKTLTRELKSEGQVGFVADLPVAARHVHQCHRAGAPQMLVFLLGTVAIVAEPRLVLARRRWIATPVGGTSAVGRARPNNAVLIWHVAVEGWGVLHPGWSIGWSDRIEASICRRMRIVAHSNWLDALQTLGVHVC
ncbi:hypothetical protein IWX46DRAFT_237677 [Phyllosticta citricarpa]|uniref:Uncharacterized protein n=1 Tax=Phyllosticta citricarpa TaxID=55181 RepID=A0ABR1LS25_9PEZI